MTALRKVVGYTPEVRALARQVGNLAEDIDADGDGSAAAVAAQITALNSYITNITNILGGQLFYNVKDFGAKGNGTHNDRTAIRAAIAAADAATYGGIVYFPPGDYRTTGVLTSSARASIVGSGPLATSITTDHATANTLELNPAFAGHIQTQYVSGIKFRHAQANTGSCLVLGGGTYHVADCEFGDKSNGFSDGKLITDSADYTYATFSRCLFYPDAEAAAEFTATGTDPYLKFYDCYFEPSGAAYAPAGHGAVVYGDSVYMFGCVFDGYYSSGTYACYKARTTTLRGGLHGCTFEYFIAGSVTGIVLGTYVAASQFSESGNRFDDGGFFTAYSYTITGAQVGANVHLYSRETRHKRYSSNAATLTLAADQYGAIYVDRTGNAACTYTTTLAPEGAGLRVVIYASGGAGSGVQTTDFVQPGTAVAVATTATTAWELVATVIASTLSWVNVSAASVIALAAHAALTTGAHGMTAFGASLVDDATALAGRTTLGLGAFTTGSGAPAGGSDGDGYLRTDTPGTALQRLYVKDTGVWVGIL